MVGPPSRRMEFTFGACPRSPSNTRAQTPPWMARSLFELARALLDRGRRRDEPRAIDQLQRAETLAHELGMRSLAARVTRHRAAPA